MSRDFIGLASSGGNSAVECQLPKLDVAGSIPVPRSDSSGVIGKMISPQNIAVGVTTVSLIGQEGEILRRTFWHSLLLALGLSALAFAQAYWLKGIVP